MGNLKKSCSLKTKHLFTTLVIYFLLSITCKAQSTFEYIIGGYDNELGKDMILAPDGGYFITGGTGSFGEGSYDILLIKTDINGKIEWSRSYGTAYQEIGLKLKLDKTNNIVIAANVSYLNITYGTLILKTDLQGNMIWNKYIQYESVGGLLITNKNDILVNIGIQTSSVIVKMDSNGNLKWCKNYSGAPGYAGGIYETLESSYISVMSNFGIHVVMKIDTSGNLIWNRNFSNSNAPSDNTFFELADSSYVFFNTFWNSIAMHKINKSGVVKLQSKSFSGGGTVFPTSIAKISDSDYVISGSTNSFGNASGNAFLSRVDTSGNILWTNYFGSGTAPSKLLKISDGYVLCGGTSSFCDFSPSDIYLTKTNLQGFNNCIGSFGGLNVYDTVPTFVVQQINPLNATNSDSIVNLISNTYDLFQFGLCDKREIEKVVAYPIPADKYLNIRIEFDEQDKLCPSYILPNTYYLNIYNMLGQKVKIIDIANQPLSFNNKWEFEVPLINYASGIYFWKLESNFNTLISSGKFMVMTSGN